MKKIATLISLVVLLATLWMLYQLIGDYLYLIFLIAAIALLVKNSKGAKFNDLLDK